MPFLLVSMITLPVTPLLASFMKDIPGPAHLEAEQPPDEFVGE
jgi:hypothetical protein